MQVRAEAEKKYAALMSEKLVLLERVAQLTGGCVARH